MSDEVDRLKRHLRALAAVNRQLHAELEATRPSRSTVGTAWVDQLRAQGELDGEAELVQRSDGVQFVVEGPFRRRIQSGLIALALQQVLGPPRPASDDELDALVESAPVAVLEGPSGAPFVVVGDRRYPLRGLPLTNPVSAEEMQAFIQGPELDLGAVLRPARSGRAEVERDVSKVEVPSAHEAGPPLPTCLIIGAQKCATRWLRYNLGRHPDVFMAKEEGVFFHSEERFFDLGVGWYRERFSGWSGQPIVGESTPAYMMWRHRPEAVAERIHHLLPDVRLLAVLRNPVERAYSALVHHIVKGRIPAGTGLLEYVRSVAPEEDQLCVIAGGWYAKSLAPFVRRFGERLLVLLIDDPGVAPQAVFDAALAHVGASPGFSPPDLEKVRFSNTPFAGDQPALTSDERSELYEFFRDDILELEQMLGRDLSFWSAGGVG